MAPLRRLEGVWEGAGRGEPGTGVSKREYRFEMGGRYVSVRNRSIWEPKKQGDAPEVHDDFGVFSFDRKLGKVVFRQFHVERFVNEYTMEAQSADGFEFASVRIENIPTGYRAKESYQFVSADEVVETFSLAAPGKEFEVYSQTRLKRSSAKAAGSIMTQ